MKALIPIYPVFLSFLCILFTGNFALIAQDAQSDTLQQSIVMGRKLFHGEKRLTNKGPVCMSCHHVSDPHSAISGGTYGLDLTKMYETFGAEALHTFIGNSPFPVMKAAFEDHPVTDAEVQQLTAYLQYTSDKGATNASSVAAGLQFLWIGLGGLVLILLVIYLSWRKRKMGSVNKRIYQRQLQSI